MTVGWFVHPTIVDNPPDDARLVTHPPAGPIISLLRWSSDIEVVNRVNVLRIGVGVCVASVEASRARAMAERLNAEYVALN